MCIRDRANIANDPSVDLNPTLSWEVNVLAMQQLADNSARAGVKQFIYASSGSVYGMKDEPNVTEDLSLVPISVYNKTKMVAERVLLSYGNQMAVHCIRPATVCGWSPRMRLDVSVNMLTMQALQNKNKKLEKQVVVLETQLSQHEEKAKTFKNEVKNLKEQQANQG